jgi:hypothetical protein
VYQLSVSATTGTDVFGNPFQQGFQGPQFTVAGNQAASTVPTGSTVTSSAVVTANNSGQIINTNTSGFTGLMPINQTDITLVTTTSTSPVTITKSWSIPAGDGQQGTVYRLQAWGEVNYNATTVCTLSCVAYGFTVSCSLGAGLNTNTSYEWVMTNIVQMRATGSSGTATVWMTGTYSQHSVNLGATLTHVALTNANGGFAANTTIGQTISMQGSFAGGSGNTVRCFGSILERLGP